MTVLSRVNQDNVRIGETYFFNHILHLQVRALVAAFPSRYMLLIIGRSRCAE